jgi:RNA recognition motif-containing protein
MHFIVDSLVTLPVTETIASADHINTALPPARKDCDYDWTFFIGDLTKEVCREDLFDLFAAYGTVVDVILKRPATSSMLKVNQ